MIRQDRDILWLNVIMVRFEFLCMIFILRSPRNFFVRSWTASLPTRCIRHGSSSRCMSSVLESIEPLQNDYYALRHGQSMANVAQIIASNPDIATKKYGLSDLGKEQATKASHKVVQEFQSKNYDGILILSSDLLRAKETAEIVSLALEDTSFNLYSNSVVVEKRLRERGFGAWDGGSDKHYFDVWIDDAKDPNHEVNGVESVVAVTERATAMIADWDQKVKNYMVICVAHGDVLQILQTAFAKIDGSLHRTLPHLETASLRQLIMESQTPKQ